VDNLPAAPSMHRGGRRRDGHQFHQVKAWPRSGTSADVGTGARSGPGSPPRPGRWPPCRRRHRCTWAAGAGTVTSSTRCRPGHELGQVPGLALDRRHGETVATLPALLSMRLAGSHWDGHQLHQVKDWPRAGAGARPRPGPPPRRDGGHPAGGAVDAPGRPAPGRRPAPPGEG
jgi:hypothetical protein